MIAANSATAFAQLVQRVYNGKVSVTLAKRVWDASRDGHTGVALGSIDDDEREQLTDCLIPNGLLVMEFGQLYLPRFAAMEARIAKALLDRRLTRIAAVSNLDDIVKAVAPSANLQQATAIRAGLSQALLLLTGGPGTGKSFTLRALCAALKLQNPNARIAATAPTANAAQRLADVGATSVGTIHKLLGLSPMGRSAPLSSQLPLPFDVVIVDEASMLSAELSDQLLGRLGSQTQLVLAGDRNQLASIDAGEVFSQACVLDDCVVTLTENRRFAELSDLSKLSQALIATGPSTDEVKSSVIRSLAQPLMRQDLQSFEALTRYAIEQYQQFNASTTQLIHRFRVITATNEGPFGVNAINNAIDDAMRRKARVARDAVWYPGRLIVIQRNDVSTVLRNGQTGVCLQVDSELSVPQLLVRFDDEREFAVDRIPDHSSAWAITVHKSQGAEYDEVVFVLPAIDSVMFSPSLIYTAITRAKTRLGIVGDIAALGQGGNKSNSRSSAIGVRLASS